MKPSQNLYQVVRLHLQSGLMMGGKPQDAFLRIKCFKIVSCYQDLEAFNLAYMISIQDYLCDV